MSVPVIRKNKAFLETSSGWDANPWLSTRYEDICAHTDWSHHKNWRPSLFSGFGHLSILMVISQCGITVKWIIKLFRMVTKCQLLLYLNYPQAYIKRLGTTEFGDAFNFPQDHFQYFEESDGLNIMLRDSMFDVSKLFRQCFLNFYDKSNKQYLDALRIIRRSLCSAISKAHFHYA